MKIRHWHNRNHNADDIFKKIAIIFFCLSFFYIAGAIEQIFDLKTGGVNLKIEYNFADKNDICGSLILGVPDGCKIPKKPTISVQKYENLENFHYDDSGISEKDIDGKYRMDFRISIVDATNENNLLQLKIDCPICEGHSCRIEGVNLAISFSHSWQHKFCMMMFIGFLGGIILNFMPCVLPVLLLKLKSVLSPDRKTALAGAIAGNYASFLSIALLLSLLKMGGTPVGWGFHFQNFVFLKIAAVVLFLLVLQAFGIISPSPSIRPKNVARSVFAENFLSSIIACFLAIPCTAPFLGTASVFALRESPIEMFLIFLAIATGFSLPLLGIAFLRFHLPKNFQKYSGAAQKLVSCGVLLAFGWVLWLLANHLANSIIMLYILTFLLCFWLFKVRRSALAGTFAAALLLVPENWDQDRWKNTTIHYVYQSTADVAGKISAALAKNMPVILDISADWCLTCSYNKLRLLNDTAVQEMLVKNDVLHIEIDLTKRSDEWTAFISQHGRSGIPFMMVYGPRFPNGRLLPEIPSVDQLLDAIKSAKTN